MTYKYETVFEHQKTFTSLSFQLLSAHYTRFQCLLFSFVNFILSLSLLLCTIADLFIYLFVFSISVERDTHFFIHMKMKENANRKICICGCKTKKEGKREKNMKMCMKKKCNTRIILFQVFDFCSDRVLSRFQNCLQ